VIGASDKPTIGRRLIISLDRISFADGVFPVNPNYSTVLGRRCWPSIAELPETPDVALFCMGHERMLEAFRRADDDPAATWSCCALPVAAFAPATTSAPKSRARMTGATTRPRRSI
jgi:acyl-CoA synthetase (NDP forming)